MENRLAGMDGRRWITGSNGPVSAGFAGRWEVAAQRLGDCALEGDASAKWRERYDGGSVYLVATMRSLEAQS
jgi:hypothetical protein